MIRSLNECTRVLFIQALILLNTPNQTGHLSFYHNDAIRRLSGTTVQADCYFGKYKVGPPPGVPATKWEDYPQIQVKNYLLSLIVEGEHTFENITPDPEV